MDAVFIVEVIGLTLSPICKVVWSTICPDKCTLAVSVIQSNPTPGPIQTMLHVNIFFLISNADEVGVVILAGLLSFSPILARLTGWVAYTRKVWPSWFTNVYKNEHKTISCTAKKCNLKSYKDKRSWLFQTLDRLLSKLMTRCATCWSPHEVCVMATFTYQAL